MMKFEYKRFMLITTALATGSSMIASTAMAQSNSADDEIIVTGSRIPQDPNLILSVPVQSLDKDDIRMSGEISLAEIINDIPALVSSTSY